MGGALTRQVPLELGRLLVNRPCPTCGYSMAVVAAVTVARGVVTAADARCIKCRGLSMMSGADAEARAAMHASSDGWHPTMRPDLL